MARPGRHLIILGLAATILSAQAAQPDTDYGQLPGERQRFRVLGATRTYVTSQSWVEVSYAALVDNAAKVRWHMPADAVPLAVVKANAYGHGLGVAAQAFLDGGFAELGVADVNEAIMLRQEGVVAPIHVMYQPDLLAARVMALEDVEVYVEDLAFVRALCEETLAVQREAPMQVHVMVAAGGMLQAAHSLEAAMELIEFVHTCASLHLRGIATEHADSEEVQGMLARLRDSGARIGGVSLAAGAQTLQRDRELEPGTIVRVGAALYGQQTGLVPGTQLAASWYTRIASIRKVEAGDLLHEGHSSSQGLTVAVIYHGYTDSYQVDEVTIHGKPCPRVDLGRSMRVTLVNVSHVPDAKIGDLVTLHDGCTNGNPFNLASVSIGVPRIPKW